MAMTVANHFKRSKVSLKKSKIKTMKLGGKCRNWREGHTSVAELSQNTLYVCVSSSDNNNNKRQEKQDLLTTTSIDNQLPKPREELSRVTHQVVFWV